MKRKARTDDNHAAIRMTLRICGWYVRDCSAVGDGFADFLLAKPGRGIVLVEVKDPAKPPSKRKLTSAQVAFHAAMLAAGSPVRTVMTIEDAVTL
jgi:hypothetical protein